jgi:N4-bis(aminopropyl)spermidine synthase
VDDGFFKILGAVAGHGGLDVEAVAQASGEAPTVLSALREAKPAWLAERDGILRCTEKGYEAYCREAYARRAPAIEEATRVTYERFAARRAPANRDLDQVFATSETALARAARLVESGETQRGLCILGDDDLTSVALAILGVGRQVTVLEIDAGICEILEDAASELGVDRRIVRHDLRDPTPPELRGRFGAVLTDPPYAIEGFRLFVGRATELLRDDGRLIVSFGQSRRSVERGLEKQRALTAMGYFIEEVRPDFMRYEGATSIGSSSAFYTCRRTPMARAAPEERMEGDIYTKRSPRRRR